MSAMLGLISQVCTNVCMKTCPHWEIQKWLLNNVTEPRQMSLPVWISWAPPTAGEVSQRLGYLSSPERSITSPLQLKYLWGVDKIWGKDWDSINFRIMSFVLEQTHRHSVYLHLHMYVCELFLQKGQQDQVIYIFDKNIKTYLREVEKPVFLLCRGCWD